MGSIAVTFVQPDGEEIIVDDAADSGTLMEVALANGVEGIMADCGGACACATCHVLIDEDWQAVVGPANDVEGMTLEMAGDAKQESSRLCCQINMSPELDGLKVTVSPVEY